MEKEIHFPAASKRYPPFIKNGDSVTQIMSDVIIALVPSMAISYFAFGLAPVLNILISVSSAILSEFIFSSIFLGNKKSISDRSAVVTGILLAMTLAPFTPPYVVAFGAATAVIFGKLIWGGLGKNFFNPALVGREFMAAFFPAIMNSRTIWYDKNFNGSISVKPFNFIISDNFTNYLNNLVFKPAGAIGEYSILLLTAGGLFLLLKKRISWTIVFPLLSSFTLFTWISGNIKFSLGGLILGSLFMATDMPSSATSKTGKIYYGTMIGITSILFIMQGVKYEYMSYSILLLNGFSRLINNFIQPKTWGKKYNPAKLIRNILLLSLAILTCTFFIILLYKYEAVKYLVFFYMAISIVYFNKKII